jgi:hypothetical protein
MYSQRQSGVEAASHQAIAALALRGTSLSSRPLVSAIGHPASRPGAMTVAGAAAAARRNQVPLGIAYMVGSTVMFAGGNAV